MFEGRSVFHESYYEHSCAVIAERDVLYNEIVGSTWTDALKRWWYNLFLLSYNDERCRIYYASSQAMRTERWRQFRRYRSRIHPMSKFSNFWDCFILVVVVFNRVNYRHTTSILFGEVPMAFYILGIINESIILLDLVIQLKTGYIDQESRKIILNPRKGYIKYCSTRLFLHVAGAIPMQTIMMLRYGSSVQCVLCKANKFMGTIRLIGVLSWFRIYDASKYLSRERGSFRKTYCLKFLRIGILGLITMMQFLYFSNNVNAVIMTYREEIHETSYLAMLIKIRYWTKNPPGNFTFMCMELSQMIQCLFLFGLGPEPKVYYVDILFTLIAFVLANFFYVWSLLECFAVMNRRQYAEDQTEIQKRRTMNLLQSRQLDDNISCKVMDYYHYNICKLILIEKTNDLYKFLPTSLTNEIKLFCYTRYMRNIPFFSEWPAKIVDDLVMMLKEEVFLQHDLVSDAWSVGDGLVIVETGLLAVYTYFQQETGHLIDGDYYGDVSLVTDNEVRTSFVVAASSCKVLILPKNQFRIYMRKYPVLFFEMRELVKMKYHKEASDIYLNLSISPRISPKLPPGQIQDTSHTSPTAPFYQAQGISQTSPTAPSDQAQGISQNSPTAPSYQAQGTSQTSPTAPSNQAQGASQSSPTAPSDQAQGASQTSPTAPSDQAKGTGNGSEKL